MTNPGANIILEPANPKPEATATNNDYREKRIARARKVIRREIRADILLAAAIAILGVASAGILVYRFCTGGWDLIFEKGWSSFLLLLLFLCVGLLQFCFWGEINRYNKLLQDVAGNLEIIESIEVTTNRMRRSAPAVPSTTKTNTPGADMWTTTAINTTLKPRTMKPETNMRTPCGMQNIATAGAKNKSGRR